uniref:Myosin motor domain-containing protein n=1 Tax=Amphora coffeiformis TaxID=265554 RepID=A0A7S3L5G5_9STRA
MEAGASVWCRDNDGEDAWILCEVLKKTPNEIQLKQKGKPDNVFSKSIASVNEETGERKFADVELANTPLSEEDKADGRDNDLITLPHLHEPAILHALSDRFFRGKIYTWTGPVLIAVNPFQRLPLYTDDILETYRRDGLLKAQGLQSGQDLEPHVFAIADRSFRQMMSDQRKSQSILISGESGAGKTETTKIVMLYLTTLGAATSEEGTTESGEDSTMQRVLQSNPVLEAFGNARTLRNDNSSRFGKFIELGFSRAGHLMGAKVQTYLLEKVRLAFHAAGERNYHIFYQLLRGCKDEDHTKYEFHDGLTGGLDLPNFFHYTGQGGAPHLREFSDESGFEYTLKAMRRLGWSEETIDEVLKLVAGLLHLGQISFNQVEKDGMDIAEVANDKLVGYASRLLGVDAEKLKVALTERIIVARGQEIRTNLTPDKAVDARDALAKTIYGALFLWVVDQVNASIGWKNDSDIRSSCGVLDIFGFECFAVNSFEQLCINYTNEALQQQFNQFIFKLEQAEYSAENIEWAFIEFPDNQDCLDTIQAPKVGVLAMLDDECRLPKGSDRNFAKRMFDQYLPEKNMTVSENTRFHATNVQKAKSIFCIRHFAGLVAYTAETNFMEKNKDEIPLTAQTLFETAPSQLIQDTYAVQQRENLGRAAAEAKTSKQPKSKTVGQQFKEQLSSLIDSVQKTDPHYIRCIKPNDAAKPLQMTRKRTTEQLRYGGVLEAVRVARAGYPVRLVHTGFYQRYRMLLPTVAEDKLPWSMEGKDAQQLCVRLVDAVLEEGEKQKAATANGPLDPKEQGITRSEKIRRMQNQPIPMSFPKADVQLGKTKVFMRKHPHDCLEAHRVFHQHASATVVQCWARGLAKQRTLYIIQDAVQTIQRCYRGSKGRERWTVLRQAQAGLLLTKVFRMLIVWRRFNRSRQGTIRFQGIVRGRNLRRVFAANKAQQHYRKFIAEKKFRRIRSAVLSLQCAKRARDAKSILNEMKKEQKDVGKLKNMNTKLKEEMASLRAMLAAQAKESSASLEYERALAAKQKEIDELEKRVAELEKDLNDAKKFVEKLETELSDQRQSSAQDKETILQMKKRGFDPNHKRRPSADPGPPQNIPTDYVNPEILAEHRSHVARLEEELEGEKRLRREVEGEVYKLRAAMNGVKLDEEMIRGLMDPSPSPSGFTSEENSVTGDESPSQIRLGAKDETAQGSEEKKDARSQEVKDALVKLGIEEKQEPATKSSLLHNLKASADFIPMIRRGFAGNEEKEGEEALTVGWKVEIRNRREREEALRDDVHRFEIKLKKFSSMLDEGVDVVMWQLNRGQPDVSGGDVQDEFALKASHVTVKMHRRGDLFVQAVLTFMLRGGYLSKAIGRNRNVDKSALEPLSLHDILEVRAGCAGYDHTELPTASGKTKKKKDSKGSGSENKQSSLFMTIKATPTPVASSRAYIFRFKSRSTRNDVLNGLRSILADMQIHEGVSISGLQSKEEVFEEDKDHIMVPLAAVHEALNRERESYDRILLMLLQGNEDLKEKEDESLKLRQKLESMMEQSKEKDRVQANDSKLIMQLSKKLESLLMDNEELRDQRDRLNTRLVSLESDSLNRS